MIAFISWVINRSVRARTGIDAVIMIILLIMMVAMLVGPAYLYLTTLTLTLGDVVIWEIAVFMSVGMMPIGVLLFARLWMEGDPDRKAPLPLSNVLNHVPELRASYIVFLLANELLMGWTFNLASGVIALSSGYSLGAVASQISYSITSYWFVFTMAAEMAFTLFAFRKDIRPPLLALLVLQGIVMFLTPTAVSSSAWETYTVYLEGVVMTGVIFYAIWYIRKQGRRDRPVLGYMGLFIVTNAVMMGGFLLWLINSDTLLLALSLVVQTAIYFDAVLTGAGLGQTFSSAVPSAPLAPAVPSPATPVGPVPA